MSIAQKIRDHEHLVWNRVYKRTGGKPLSWHKIWGFIGDGIIAKMRPRVIQEVMANHEQE